MQLLRVLVVLVLVVLVLLVVLVVLVLVVVRRISWGGAWRRSACRAVRPADRAALAPGTG
ncbi:MAG TPA: hypothetical protein DD420_39425 [Streptomyces sp.]|nr:hypothetical protein [Streptomyces sp.]